MHQRRSALFISTAVGVCGWVVIAAPAAYASCAGPPEPSPHAFVGRVIDTESDDRVATVRTTGGETVQVLGTPSANDGTFTSVDRTYVVGATYEFHPLNNSHPYTDNACTATKRLQDKGVRTSLEEDSNGADVQTQNWGGDNIAAAGAIAGAAIAGVGGAGLWLRRRRGLHAGS